MQHLLIDSENSMTSQNSITMGTGEGRHGTSAISFLGALRIPVSMCAVVACSCRNQVLPPCFHEVLDEVIDITNFASRALIGDSGVHRLKQILMHETNI